MQPQEDAASTVPANDRTVRPRRGPLAGIRVTDFCWYGVGSCATRLLADFGAEVIKIEHESRLDGIRFSPLYKRDGAVTWGDVSDKANPEASGMFNNYCRNKLSLSVDVKTAEGRSLVERLVATSDIVTENFAPGVMERLGFTYSHLASLQPSIIYARMSGYGHSGPHSGYKSFGPTVQAASGLSHLAGLPGHPPSGIGFSYMDNQAAYYNANAIMMALLRRSDSGVGTEIDVSAVEVAATMLGPVLLDVAVNERSTRTADFPLGNRLEWPRAAPHGVFPTREDDRWVAIAVFDETQWAGFRRAINEPEWSAADAFADQADRRAHQTELEAHLSAWTRERGATEIAELLQRHGVPAGAVQNARDLREHDPQTRSRGLFFSLDHPVIGVAEFESTPIRFSTIRQDNWRSAPLVGEDNDYVVDRVLGPESETPDAETRRAGAVEAAPRTDGGVLRGLRVVELGSSVAGEVVGKVFAQLGADVVKVEPPGGARSRRIGPFAGGVEDGEHSLHFWNYNVAKRSVEIDYERDGAGRERLFAMLRHADVCVTSFEVAEARALGLEARRLGELDDALIVVSVTPFGLTGPRAEWRSSDLVSLALGGFLNSCGYSDHSLPPVRPGGHQAYQQAASYAQSGTLLALLHRQQTGEGQLVDVAIHDTVTLGTELAIPYWLYSRAIVQRQTCRNAAPTPTQPTMFQCSDGRWVTFVYQVNNDTMWSAVLDWLRANDLELDLGEPEYLDAGVRRERMGHIQGAFEVLFALHTADEATRAGQARGLPLSVINAPEDLLTDEHLVARDVFVPLDRHDGPAVPFPRVPLRFSSFPSSDAGRPPRVGEHTDEVTAEWSR